MHQLRTGVILTPMVSFARPFAEIRKEKKPLNERLFLFGSSNLMLLLMMLQACHVVFGLCSVILRCRKNDNCTTNDAPNHVLYCCVHDALA